MPRTARPGGFHHRINKTMAALGQPEHRSIDLITSVTEAKQSIEGQLRYGADKASEDEDVEVYGCLSQHWQLIGRTRTDGDGHFAIVLEGAARLPAGLHPLFASSVADRTGVGFLAYVAAASARVAVTDIDGTLTTSENGIVRSILFGSRLGAQPGASGAFQHLASAGFQLVYLTSRPRGATELTRTWLADHAFPPGPVVTASGLTLPGGASLAYKTRSLDRLRRIGVPLTIGIGNRATDVLAYTRAGLSGDRIFMKESGYAAELQNFFDANQATDLASYDQLVALATK